MGCPIPTARAQSGSSSTDSLKTYELSEIVVGGEVRRERQVATVRRVSLAAIVREDASSTADLVHLVPSAYLQTNSRGESLIYVRNAGERQVSVFFDGALLNIPWDNRIDMSMIPGGMLGGMEVSKGPLSVVYGANVVGGAVNLQSRSLERSGSLSEFTGVFGTQSTAQLRGGYLYRAGEWSAQFSGSIQSTDGFRVPGEADLDFSQTGGPLRINTDRSINNLFVRVGREMKNGSRYGVSVLYVDSEKGVAPEGHLNPDTDRVRFWRYPLWRNTMWIANGSSKLGVLGDIRATVWYGRFSQRIDQYETNAYERITDREKDRDQTLGMRVLSSRSMGPGSFRMALNYLVSTHNQTDLVLGEAFNQLPPVELTYRQHIYSFGVEYEVQVDDAVTLLGGGSLDGTATPKTGDKPHRDAISDYGLMAGVNFALSEANTLRLSVGRKVRFPTMRELFGEAIHSFLLNPELRPESSFLGEIALEHTGSRLAGELVFFMQRTYDTIDQENVVVDGLRRRRRINLEGSRVLGLEIVGSVAVLERVSIDGHLSIMDPEAFHIGGTRKLNEKPVALGTLSIHMSTRWGASFRSTLVYTGRAYANSPDNMQVALPPSKVLNLRVALRKYVERSGLFAELFMGVNNLTDELTLPQLGLPGAGRAARVGLGLTF